MSSRSSHAVTMTLLGTEYMGQIVHSTPASSIVAWGHPDIDLEGGVFMSLNPQVCIFKASSANEVIVYLVLQGSEHEAVVMIDLMDNILMQDSERPNVLGCVKEASTAGVRITFEDVESAEDFEIWMHAALLEAAAQGDNIPLSVLLDVLSHPEGLEYDEEHDVFPGIERLLENAQNGTENDAMNNGEDAAVNDA